MTSQFYFVRVNSSGSSGSSRHADLIPVGPEMRRVSQVAWDVRTGLCAVLIDARVSVLRLTTTTSSASGTMMMELQPVGHVQPFGGVNVSTATSSISSCVERVSGLHWAAGACLIMTSSQGAIAMSPVGDPDRVTVKQGYPEVVPIVTSMYTASSVVIQQVPLHHGHRHHHAEALCLFCDRMLMFRIFCPPLKTSSQCWMAVSSTHPCESFYAKAMPSLSV